MGLAIAKRLKDMTENEWDGELFRGDKSLAAMTGWQFRYHVLRSKGSQPGFPDRVLVRERVVYVETKSETGKATAEQIEWLNALAKAGQECYLWRPSDLDEIGRILAGRCRFLPRGDRTKPASADETPLLAPAGRDAWTPGSLWIPDHGRYDGT